MPYPNSMFWCAHYKLVALVAALVSLVATSGPTQAQTVPNRSATGWSSLPPDARGAILAALEGEDPWIQQAELIASNGKTADGFGFSAAVSGSTAVVGAPDHNVGSNYSQGAAYVFVQSGGTWIQQAKLTASDGATNDLFGTSVAVSGSTILVGASLHPYSPGHDGSGAAYVFVESGGTWSQQAELTSSDGAAGDGFGYSVAVDGSTAVVGAPWHMVGSNLYQGAAYVFVESDGTWSQQAELTASDGTAYDYFGHSVAVSGSTAVVGAPGHNVGSNYSQGAAYVFAESGGTWSQQAELTASDGSASDQFGTSSALSGSTMVVGAPDHEVGSNYSQGAAYVFVESVGTWSQQAELSASDGAPYDNFALSLALSGSTMVVGAPDHKVGSNNSQGAVYVFGESGGTWSQQSELTASHGAAGDQFGRSVALSGSTVVVGAPWHNVGSKTAQGVAYVFVPGASTVTVSAASLSFGNEAIDTTSPAKTVTLKNTGLGTVDISSIAASANFSVASSTCGAILFVATTCTVSVAFTPTEPGGVTGTLSLTDDAQSSPQTVRLSGAGVEPATLTPAKATYTKQAVGTTSASKTFTLTNNQTVALTSLAISTTGDFAVSATTCGASLAAKSKCTISVTFTPTQIGSRTGQLVANDSANNSPQTSNLTGTGK